MRCNSVVVTSSEGMEFEYVEEFPVKLLADFPAVARRNASRVIVVSMEYGKDFSGRVVHGCSTPEPDTLVPSQDGCSQEFKEYFAQF